MTWAEIAAAYPDEWVLLAETEYEASYAVASARVLAHGDRREPLVEELDRTCPAASGVLFTGREIPVTVAGFIL